MEQKNVLVLGLMSEPAKAYAIHFRKIDPTYTVNYLRHYDKGLREKGGTDCRDLILIADDHLGVPDNLNLLEKAIRIAGFRVAGVMGERGRDWADVMHVPYLDGKPRGFMDVEAHEIRMKHLEEAKHLRNLNEANRVVQESLQQVTTVENLLTGTTSTPLAEQPTDLTDEERDAERECRKAREAFELAQQELELAQQKAQEARREAERFAQARREEEERQARLEAERKAEEARLEAERRAEIERLAEEARLREEARKHKEERQRQERERAELARIEKELREAEEARLAEEARQEALRIEEERLAEEARRIEAERREAERARMERLRQEAEERRMEAEKRERARREAEEAQQREAARAEIERLGAKRLEQERLGAKRLEQERLEAEAQLLEAERRKAEEARLREQEAQRQVVVERDDTVTHNIENRDFRMPEDKLRVVVMEGIKPERLKGRIRSGQLVSHAGDIIIEGNVHHGGEVVAGGDIHVYGKASGRLIAGVTGDVSACIYIQDFDADFISIAGKYFMFDDTTTQYQHWSGRSLKISLTDGALRFESMEMPMLKQA